MIEAKHYSATGAPQAAVALPDTLFDGTVNEPVLHRAVVALLANRRQGTHATKTRAMVSGGGRKPWRQKGTGRARQGTIRAPQWRGGGVVFGPHPRNYRTDLPRKVRRLARKSALNARAREGAIHVIAQLAFESPKTKAMVELLDKLGLGDERVVVLTAGVNRHAYLSARNLPRVDVVPFAEATAYDVLRAHQVVIEHAALTGEAPAESAESESEVVPAPGAAEKRPAKKARPAAKKPAKKPAKKAVKKAAKKATKKAVKTAAKHAGKTTASRAKTAKTKKKATKKSSGPKRGSN